LVHTESGNTDISAAILLKLSKLGYNADWILTGEGMMQNSDNTYLVAESKVIYNDSSSYNVVQELEEKIEKLSDALKEIQDVLSEHKIS
jgi:flavorubredoxin